MTLKGGIVTRLTVADGAVIKDFAYISATQSNVHVGRSLIAPRAWLAGPGDITVEDFVLLGPGAIIASGRHEINRIEVDETNYQEEQGDAIVLRKGCWVGANAVILAGITVGEGSVVGANAVVTRDVPSNTTVVGAPAHPLLRWHKS